MSCNDTKKDNAEKNERVKKDISVQLWSVRDDIKKDFKGTISQLAEMGYTGIEAAGYAEGKFYGLLPEEFKKEMDATGLHAFSSHAAKALNKDIAKTDWKEVWDWWDTAIEAHKAAGIKYVVMPWMPTPKTLSDLQSYCDYYNQIGEKCNASGLKFGYHNHDFEFQEIEGKVMYDYMLENTDPEKVFFQMDVYWVMRGGESQVDYFHKYPGRFLMFHVKDHKELGQSGMMGFDAIFKPENTDKAGVEYLIVEVEKYNFEPLESVRRSLEYLLNDAQVKASYSN